MPWHCSSQVAEASLVGPRGGSAALSAAAQEARELLAALSERTAAPSAVGSMDARSWASTDASTAASIDAVASPAAAATAPIAGSPPVADAAPAAFVRDLSGSSWDAGGGAHFVAVAASAQEGNCGAGADLAGAPVVSATVLFPEALGSGGGRGGGGGGGGGSNQRLGPSRGNQSSRASQGNNRWLPRATGEVAAGGVEETAYLRDLDAVPQMVRAGARLEVGSEVVQVWWVSAPFSGALACAKVKGRWRGGRCGEPSGMMLARRGKGQWLRLFDARNGKAPNAVAPFEVSDIWISGCDVANLARKVTLLAALICRGDDLLCRMFVWFLTCACHVLYSLRHNKKIKMVLPGSLTAACDEPLSLEVGFRVGTGEACEMHLRDGTVTVVAAPPSRRGTAGFSSATGSGGGGGGPQRVAITVPVGAAPGQFITVEAPGSSSSSSSSSGGGQSLRVQVPPHAVPGTVIQCAVPAAVATELFSASGSADGEDGLQPLRGFGSTVAVVAVPPGVAPGRTVTFMGTRRTAPGAGHPRELVTFTATVAVPFPAASSSSSSPSSSLSEGAAGSTGATGATGTVRTAAGAAADEEGLVATVLRVRVPEVLTACSAAPMLRLRVPAFAGSRPGVRVIVTFAAPGARPSDGRRRAALTVPQGAEPGKPFTVEVPRDDAAAADASAAARSTPNRIGGGGGGVGGSGGGDAAVLPEGYRPLRAPAGSGTAASRRRELEARLAVLRQAGRQAAAATSGGSGGGLRSITVKRSNFLESVMEALPTDPSAWRGEWRFKFAGEPAIDAGGVAREFWSLLSSTLFHPHSGLFMYAATDQLTYQINPAAPTLHTAEVASRMFRLAGRLLAKALLDKQLVTVSLSRPLLKHILALPVAFADLEHVDADLFRSLSWMLNAAPGEVSFLAHA